MRKDYAGALKPLERCVQLRPVFLRAWACLGATYSKLGNATLSGRAFQKCLALETDPAMKKFFSEHIPH